MSNVKYILDGKVNVKKVKNENYATELKIWKLKNNVLSIQRIYEKEYTLPPVEYIGEEPNYTKAISILLHQKRLSDIWHYTKWIGLPSIISATIATAIIVSLPMCSVFVKFIIGILFSLLALFPKFFEDDWQTEHIMITVLTFVCLAITSLIALGLTYKVIEDPIKDYEMHKFKNRVIIIWNNEVFDETKANFWNFDSTKQILLYRKVLNHYGCDGVIEGNSIIIKDKQ